METPLSARRVTRSQTLASSATSSNFPITRKVEECDNNGLSKSRQRSRKTQDLPAAKPQDRSALIDITNDSPIVGVASGNLKTPLSSVRGGRRPLMMTPGSGEALLRGQVKTLLQKVEEEAEISKLSLESRPFICLQGAVNSPATVGLLAPTPANTPQISINESLGTAVSITSTPIVEEQLISQVVSDLFDGKNQENQITRSLLLDFSEKSELTDESSSDCSSVITQQELKEKPSPDDDNASVWSIQVNASSHDGDGDGEEDLIGEEEEDDIDELCEGLSRINVNEMGRAAEFAGKHTRFLYDSDDELVIEEVSEESSVAAASGVLRLKGLPTPKGKHLRFPAEEDEELDG